MAVNAAEAAPARTVTDVGRLRSLLLEESATEVAAVAAEVSVTVQELACPEISEVGLQLSELRFARPTRLRVVVFETPARLAVRVTDWLDPTIPAVAVKVPVAAPAGTVIEPGMASPELLADRLTTAPEAGAAAVKVTVQAALPPEERLEGVHASFDNAAAGETVRVPLCETPA